MCTLPTDLWALASAGCLFQLGWREEEGLRLDQGPGLCNVLPLSQLGQLEHVCAYTHMCAHTTLLVEGR